MNGFPAYSGVERRVNTSTQYWGRDRRSFWDSLRPDERALIERAARHDREAFARLFDRFVDNIYRYVYYRVGDQAIAEELTAGVFVHASESIYDNKWWDGAFAIWLYRLAQWHVNEYLQGQQVTEPAAQTMELSQISLPNVGRLLAKLSADQQLVVILRLLEGYNIEQIAELMGKHPGAVRALEYRALVIISGLFRKGPG